MGRQRGGISLPVLARAGELYNSRPGLQSRVLQRIIMSHPRILVSGATGYVGGRLVPLLLQRGYQVRCMVREPRHLLGRWAQDTVRIGQIEIVYGDVLEPESLTVALSDVDSAYYLIHAMGKSGDYAERDRIGAANFAKAAAEAGVGRILYLGGLGRRDHKNSKHLESRHETGDVLRSGTVPVTELRAAAIVGSGSASFEMMRHLAEKLPIMVSPKWINTRTQPILITDALEYLIAALECPEAADRVLDIGGPDILTYRQMIEVYAHVRRLKRWIFVVPILTPRISAYWINLVTPIPASIAFPLIEGLRSETIVENDDAQQLLKVPLTPFRQAVERAVAATDNLRVPTRWSDAVEGAIPESLDQTPKPEHSLITNRQAVPTDASAAMLNRAVSRIGGEVGWYYADWLWDIRGAMDRIIGGVGVRRGRRHPDQIEPGDAIDFWRVEDYRPERLLLRAEMKVPGRAWLEFRIVSRTDGTRELIQTAYFIPRGFWGYAYWYGSMPFHIFVFSGMAHNIVRWAEQQERLEPVETEAETHSPTASSSDGEENSEKPEAESPPRK